MKVTGRSDRATIPPASDPGLETYWGTKLAVGCFLGAWVFAIGLSLFGRKPPPEPPVKPWTSMVDEHADLTVRH